MYLILIDFFSWYITNPSSSYILTPPSITSPSRTQQFKVYFYAIDRRNYTGHILLGHIVTHYIGNVNGSDVYMKINNNEIYFIIPRNDNGDLLSDHFTFKKDRWMGRNGFDFIPFHKTMQNKITQIADQTHAWFEDNINIDLNNIGDISCFYKTLQPRFALSSKFSENDLIIITDIINLPLSRNYVGGAKSLEIDSIELKINDLLDKFFKNENIDNIKLSVIVDDNILHISIFFDEKNITKNYYEQYKLIK